MESSLIPLLSFFILGFLGSSHCLVMCSPISTGVGSQSHGWWNLIFLNAGRVFTYSALGFFVGGLALGLQSLSKALDFRTPLQLASALMTMMMAGFLLKWWDGLSPLARFGSPIWKKLKPQFQNFLPVDSGKKAFVAGLLWGFLPCGLVYSASLSSLQFLSPWRSLEAMFFFGVGTWPANLFMGALGQSARRHSQNPWIRKTAGALLMVWGIFLVLEVMEPPWGYRYLKMDCDLSEKVCENIRPSNAASKDYEKILAEISPRPVYGLQKIHFKIHFSGAAQNFQEVSATLRGIDMDMGYHHFGLHREGIAWEGDYFLPACTPPKMKWQLALKLKSVLGYSETSFYFTSFRIPSEGDKN